MEHKMKSTILAKKLREKLASLSKEREAAKKVYERDIAKWKKDVAAFIAETVPERISRIAKSDLSKGNYYRCCSGLPDFVFKDVPRRPEMPDFDKFRRKVKKGLNYLAIVAPVEVQVSERMLEDWGLTEEEDAED